VEVAQVLDLQKLQERSAGLNCDSMQLHPSVFGRVKGHLFVCVYPSYWFPSQQNSTIFLLLLPLACPWTLIAFGL
jgi:hypothetical protein